MSLTVDPDSPSLPPPVAPSLPPPVAPIGLTPRPHRRRGAIIGGAIAAVVIAAVAVGVAVAWPEDRWPSKWDRRIEGLAAFVESERGADFEHAVEIEFLPEDEFVATLQGDATTDTGPVSDEDEGAMMRAVGWIGPDVDWEDEADEVAGEGTLAYYVPAEQRMVVRGEPQGELAAGVRATIVHELTHAWQDQHLGLGEGYDEFDADLAWRALVEGDAMRVEETYVATLSSDEQDEYYGAFEDQAAGEPLAPEAPGVELAFFAPYLIGSSFVATLVAVDGDDAVDAAFDHPPASSVEVLFASRYLDGDSATAPPVSPPAVPDDAEAIGEPVSGGAWELYVTLAGRIDAKQAFHAMRGWAAGTQQAWRTADGDVCVGWALAGDDGPALDQLHGALTTWSEAGPRGTATVDRSDTTTTLTACDPGDAAQIGDQERYDRAMALIGAHVALVASLAEDIDIDAAECVTGKLIDDRDASFFAQQELSDDELTKLFDDAATFAEECGSPLR